MHTKCVVLAVVIFIATILTGCHGGPQAVVSNVTRQEHPEFIDGQMDWGSEVSFDVRNDGEPGTIHVNVNLSSSEGQWARTQDLYFEKGESKRLTYFFQEPTINATNLQAVVQAN